MKIETVDMTFFSEKTKKKNIENIYTSLFDVLRKGDGKNKDFDTEFIYKAYLNEFFDKLTKLPFPFQRNEAVRWLKILKAEYGIDPDSYLYDDNSDEKKHYLYIKKVSESNPDYLSEINSLKSEIANNKRMIEGIMKSKVFRLCKVLACIRRITVFQKDHFKKA